MRHYAIVKAFSPVGIEFQGGPPENIQWAPPGKHSIRASRGNEPVDMDVMVEAEAVEALNRSLEKIKGDGFEPYIDFNHDDKEASGWVESFHWGGEDPTTGGIRAKIKWSKEGAAKLEGGAYKRFSPTFLTDSKGKIIGTTPNAGGLVNRPAFRQIASVMQASETDQNHLLFVSASDQPEDEQKNKPEKPKQAEEKHMSDEDKKKMDELEAENKQLKAKLTAMEEDKDKAEAKAKEIEVKSLVDGAIRDKKIMAKDTKQIEAITALAYADTANAKTFIDSMPNAIDETLFARVTPNQGGNQPIKAQDKESLMNAKVAEIKAKNPNISGSDAFEAAATAYPEIFSVNA
jgi:hypothetical protein